MKKGDTFKILIPTVGANFGLTGEIKLVGFMEEQLCFTGHNGSGFAMLPKNVKYCLDRFAWARNKSDCISCGEVGSVCARFIDNNIVHYYCLKCGVETYKYYLCEL